MIEREQLKKKFIEFFEREPRLFRAPGRVNLIGEHTDYNGGFVLPMAIPQRTWVALSRSGDDRVRASSTNLGEGSPLREYRLGQESRTERWIDYVQGCTHALARDGYE